MRVLILKLAALGDVVMALPMITAAKSLADNVHITWVCGRAVAPLLRRFAAIDRLVVVDEEALFLGKRRQKLAAVLYVWRQLGLARYDLAVVGNADRRYRLLLRSVRADVFRTFRRNGRSHPVSGRHHSNEYVRLITGVEGPCAPSFDLPVFEMPAIDKFRAQLVALGDRPIVAIAPGGARNMMTEQLWRRWPTSHYVAFASQLIEKGLRVVVLGGPADTDVASSLSHLPLLNLIGKTDLPELVGVMSLADVIVSHDTSFIHLARLAKRTVVGLFGPTIPSEKLFPADGSISIWGGEHLPCRPCYDGVNFHDCPSNQCMKSIDVDTVVATVTRVLAGEDRRKQLAYVAA